jgi:glutamyl-tRNA synthetase
MTTVRTRFAPSPTGYLHIGGLRTALYSYLFARKQQGTYVLRIEDTDQTRYVEGAVEALIKVLQQIDMEADEGPVISPTPTTTYKDPRYNHLTEKGDKGPYIQSERTEIYQKHAQELIEKGHAYYCFCTPEDLEKMRAEQTAAKLAPMYDRRCLKLKPEESAAKLASGTPHVIRLKIPRDRRIEFTDHVRGRVVFQGNQIDDQVLIKSDGLPTYHLANVVDDHYMEISHVLRAEEWLASTPKHLVMYEAFGWPAPEYAHLPLILNADKSKLSKRQNDVSVESYLSKGYLPEALINFVVLMGWHPGKGSEQEIFSLEDLIRQFSLEGINKAGAVFNLEKLDWLNHIWHKIKFYQKLDLEAAKINSDVKIEIAKNQDRTYTFPDPAAAEKFTQVRAQKLLELHPESQNHPYYQQSPETFLRSLLVNEEKILQNPIQTIQLVSYLFEPKLLNENILTNAKMGVQTVEQAKENLRFSQNLFTELNPTDSIDKIKQLFLDRIKSAGKKNGEILWPLRAALTHEEFSVGAFEAIWVLGKDQSSKRLEEILK